LIHLPSGSLIVLDRPLINSSLSRQQQERQGTNTATASTTAAWAPPAQIQEQLGPAAAATCTGVKATQPAALQITAGSAEVLTNAKGKIKKYGAPFGVWVDILPPGATANNATAETDCHIKARGAIKAGATKVRKISAAKLTACFAALTLADCSKPLQARAQAVAGKKFGEGPWSGPAAFTPACAPCT
jgi:hypothetical protein